MLFPNNIFLTNLGRNGNFVVVESPCFFVEESLIHQSSSGHSEDAKAMTKQDWACSNFSRNNLFELI